MATEQFNKVIDSEIGGSPICEAVKKLADVLFEARYVNKPDYENDIYTNELEGGDELDSDAVSEEEMLQNKVGTPMSVVDAKDIVSMPKKEIIGDEGVDPERMNEYTTDAADDVDVDSIINNLMPYSKTTKVSAEDREQLISEVTDLVYEFFKRKEWYDGDIEDILNEYKCSYDDFMTAKSFMEKHSVEDVYEKLLDILKSRICTVPITVTKIKRQTGAVLYRKDNVIEPKYWESVTFNIPAVLSDRQSYDASEYIILRQAADWLNMLGKFRKFDDGSRLQVSTNKQHVYSSKEGYEDGPNYDPKIPNIIIEDLFELVFAVVIPQLARILEPSEPDVEEDDDSMSPGNETPEDAYTDYEEVRERSIYDESIGTKLPGDIYNPALIEAVDHISEALFEG